MKLALALIAAAAVLWLSNRPDAAMTACLDVNTRAACANHLGE